MKAKGVKGTPVPSLGLGFYYSTTTLLNHCNIQVKHSSIDLASVLLEFHPIEAHTPKCKETCPGMIVLAPFLIPAK